MGIGDLLESDHELGVEVRNLTRDTGEPAFESLQGVEGLVGKSDVGNIALSELVALASEVGVANSELLFIGLVVTVKEEGSSTGNSSSFSCGHA